HLVAVRVVTRAIGPDAGVYRAEPEVGTGDELLFLTSRLLSRDVRHAFRFQPIVMHEVDRGFGEEMGAVETVGPGAPVVNARAGGGGEHADPVDLDVGRPGVIHRGEHLLVIWNNRRSAETADVAARQNFLRHTDVHSV